MKKLVLFLCVAMLSFVGVAQTKNLTIADGKTFAIAETDYAITNAVPRTFKWNISSAWPTTLDYVVSLDSTSGNHTSVRVALWGQKSPLKGDSTHIATVTWACTTTDTVILISNVTENRFRYINVTFEGAGTAVTTVKEQALKFYYSGE